ncbi:ROK family transcriptional regulator [Glutamicibacter sp. MNS18]|uniref:ROK family transcriptional regulator n=1 Tax=Glutamicibacter sp. MNS18 TaxID=2989817 RepID=UPI002235D185|nr:ROK family transcriptional regulator [Glutamicibacter sp. MNS18]MCW4466484.1 ROK family transcriptional regulator [Glutamicibacter sp. MNS18]
MRRGTNLGRLGDFNQAVILESIRRAPDGISRVELAGSTGLSPQTISNVVRRLLDDGIVREDRTIVSGPGKPRTVLELEGNRLVSIGIHLDPSVLTFVVMNLRGEVIRERRIDVPNLEVAGETIELMGATVKELIAEVRIPKKHIVGIGIAVPGPVNVEDGVVLNPPLLDGWADVDIVAPLRKMLRLQVIIEKDTIASAIGELWQSKEEKTEDFVFVYCGHGFGAGIVLDSDVHRGSSNNAGEIGHYSTGQKSMYCEECGTDDCLAAGTSYEFVAKQAKERGLDLPYSDDMGPEQRSEGMNHLTSLAKDGNEIAVGLIKDSMGKVGEVVGQLANSLDIGQIVFGGPQWEEVKEISEEAITEAISRRFALRAVHEIETRTSALGSKVGAIGGACAVMDASLSPKATALLLR